MTEPEQCAHRWRIDSNQTVRLTREQSKKHPNCIGRPSVCVGCGATKTQVERVWDIE